ncbi:DUF3219 family protein [Fictibacillus sp. NRS-1165]|uniref:DUF3219 family protein n=1 Tax=Fictibacillus sp. NRS-1165 TaxID=3144463 RepID=UPI003D25CEDA
MVNTVLLNEREIHVSDFLLSEADNGLIRVSFKFKVKHSEYHEITTLLYQNDFEVKVPQMELQFQAKISQYSTSLTDLYKEKAVGEFTLELTEKEKN